MEAEAKGEVKTGRDGSEVNKLIPPTEALFPNGSPLGDPGPLGDLFFCPFETFIEIWRIIHFLPKWAQIEG